MIASRTKQEGTLRSDLAGAILVMACLPALPATARNQIAEVIVARADAGLSPTLDGETFTMLPSVFSAKISPYGIGPQTLQISTACVLLPQGRIVPNCAVTLQWSSRTNSGGHLHDSNRPPGIFKTQNGVSGGSTSPGPSGSLTDNSGPTGILGQTYTSPEAAGITDLTVSGSAIVDGQAISFGPNAFTIGVKVADLPRATVAGLQVNAASNMHGNNNGNAQQATIDSLSAMVQIFSKKLSKANKMPPLLRAVALSLPQGGLFDFKNQWHPPHVSHRYGDDADIGIRELSLSERRVLGAALMAAKFTTPVKAESTSNPRATHWHLPPNLYLPVILLVWLPASQAIAVVSCPAEPNNVRVRVTAAVRYDASARLYNYAYTVYNARGSAQEVDRFAIRTAEPRLNVQNPHGWDGIDYPGFPGVLGWDAAEVADPDRVPNDASVPPSIVQIKPGRTLSGFSIQSPKPPGPVPYFVTGYVPLTGAVAVDEADAEAAAEQEAEDCPGLQLGIIDQARSGWTQGPVDAVPVAIDVEPGSDTNSINPRSQGVVPVAVLGSAKLDVRQVDLASVRLGPKQTPAQKDGAYEDANHDGFTDLMLHFQTQQIGIRCQDTALFLNGKLLDGSAVVGADSIVTVGCH